jgi:hypothetical protein
MAFLLPFAGRVFKSGQPFIESGQSVIFYRHKILGISTFKNGILFNAVLLK